MTLDTIAGQPPPLVEEALTSEPGKAGALIARFATAVELDHFSRRYNANDGFEPLRCVLRHSECDAGTPPCLLVL